jgi:hypothetical protein
VRIGIRALNVIAEREIAPSGALRDGEERARIVAAAAPSGTA